MPARDTLNQLIAGANELIAAIDAADASAAKIAELNANVAALQNQAIALQNQNVQLSNDKSALAATVATRDNAITMLQTLITQLQARVKELEDGTVVTPPPPVDPPPTTGDIGPLLQPPAGKLWLGISLPSGSLASFKSATGGVVPHIGHEYATSGSGFASDLKAADMKGTIPMVNFKPLGSMGPAAYTAILTGKADASIDQAAAAAKAYGKKFFFAPLHEPENDDLTASSFAKSDLDYAKAFRYIVERFRAKGATNAIVVWNMMGFDNHIPRYKALYPGNDVVDWIGGDPYIHKATTTLAVLGKKFYDAMAYTGKPVMWCEWGIDKPTGIASAAALLTQAELDKMQTAMPRLLALVYWNQGLGNDTDDYTIGNWPAPFGKFAKLPEFNYKLPAALTN